MKERSCENCKNGLMIVLEGENKKIDINNKFNCSLHGVGSNNRAKDCPDYEERELSENK